MKHILFFIGLFCYPFILQAQWHPVYVPTTQNLDAITFTDTLHGFIAVFDGSILESSDGGINWQTVTTGTTSSLADICFPTASIGYSVGSNGVIIKTVDAGITWPLINSPTSNVVRGVFFLNPDTGFICGQGECTYRTTDGGTTWIQQSSGAYWLRKFSFPTPQIGYCTGDNLLVFKTTDGGLTWNQLPGSGGTNLNDIQFLTVDTGYVCGLGGYIAKSFDGGQTWKVLNTGTVTDLEALWFFNSQAGYCVGLSGLILNTTDGGATWKQETSNTSAILEHLYFINPDKGFICGFEGTLLERSNCLQSPIVDAGPDQSIRYDSTTMLIGHVTGGSGSYSYSWKPSTLLVVDTMLDPRTIKLTHDTLFTLTVTDLITGCKGADSVRIKVVHYEINEDCLVFHNVITPDGDGLNDKWIIDCIGNFPENKVIIFNRWGDKVNSFDNYDNVSQVWNGTRPDGQPLPDGTYYYVLSIKNGSNHCGWILLRGIR